MVKVALSQSYSHKAGQVFEAINHINKLARIKTDIKSYRIARDEEGLQLIDVNVRFILKNFPLRLKYTAIPHKYCELKMLKGALKQYRYTYTITTDGGTTKVIIECAIKLPFRYFIVAPLVHAIIKRRIKKELALLGKILQTQL